MRRSTAYTLFAIAFCVVVGSGFVHIVHGNGTPTICTKENWGFANTFVDRRDFDGVTVEQMLPKADVARALMRCGELTLDGPR